jgi:hypothetical protein
VALISPVAAVLLGGFAAPQIAKVTEAAVANISGLAESENARKQ